MQNTAFVGVLDCAGHRDHQPGRGAEIGAEHEKSVRQVSAFDKLHAEEAAATMVANLVDRHNVRMVKVGYGLGFLAEPPRVVTCCTRAVPDHLECDQAVQAPLSCPVDDTHPATRNLAQQLVIAQVTIALWTRWKSAHLGDHRRQGIRFKSVRSLRAIGGVQLRRAERLGEAMELVLDGKEFRQVCGQVGMAIDQRMTIHMFATFSRFVVGGEHVLEPLFVSIDYVGIDRHAARLTRFRRFVVESSCRHDKASR